LHTQLEKLYPEPKPRARSEEDEGQERRQQERGKTRDAKQDDHGKATRLLRPSYHQRAAPVSGFGRGKGTLFLVDAKSRRVIWSAYAKPKNTGSDELEKVAHQIIGQLTKTLAGK
jgi:hypothetical protein